MSQVRPTSTDRLRSIPLHRVLPGLVRGPASAVVELGNRSAGRVSQLTLGSFRAYLVTDPAHVQHVLRDRAENYERAGDGMFWRPLNRLFGEGILGDGQVWSASRRTLQPLFTARKVEALIDVMAETIGSAVDELDRSARAGQPVDIGAEQARIVCQAIVRAFFADRIPVPDLMRIMAAQETIASSVVSRMMVPFVPLSMPMPGDRAFRRAVRSVDDVVVPIIRAARTETDAGDDVIATLWRAGSGATAPPDERQVRNDTVAMIAVTTETTVNVLTWLWPQLAENPEVAERLYAEIDEVVGAGPVRREHLGRLTYTRMVLDELLRLYPIGWLTPRQAKSADELGGVPIEPGATVVVSPLITQRMTAYWDRPMVFDPDRFTPDRVRSRHRYAHFPFGGGPHQCLGMHLFYLEAQLIVATILSRYRFRLRSNGVPGVRLAAALRPSDRVRLTLSPVRRVAA